MKEIVAPLPKERIIAELTPDKLLRKTNKGDNEIYVVTHSNSPAVMHEIGRLREITFRNAGVELKKRLILTVTIPPNIHINN